MADKILVTGATGTVGSLLLDQLSGTGADFRALVRNEAKAEKLRAGGVEVAQGDFEQPQTLAPALEGIDRIFLLSTPGPEQVRLQQNMIEAARRAGVRRIVKLSAIGAGPDAPTLLHDHYLIEQAIEQSGIAFTHLRPNGFMQNAFMFAHSIREQGVFYGSLRAAKVSYVDARDIAAVAKAVLTEEGYDGKAFDITGPQALSYDELAAEFSSVLGREVRYVDVSMEAVRAGMIGVGLSEWLADALVGLFDFYREGSAAHVSNAVRRITGREAMTFSQFAKDYAEAFQRSDEVGAQNAG
ncbi:MAG TPA: SDR family oxidoreductase [Pyrinomonadaceae bacterium]|jgi:uncharacterized protein YbjT (DUF2867 family)